MFLKGCVRPHNTLNARLVLRLISGVLGLKSCDFLTQEAANFPKS